MRKPDNQDFDIVVMGDFRFPGGTSSAVAAELRLLAQTRYSVGLCQFDTHLLSSLGPSWNPQVREVATTYDFPVISRDMRVETSLLIAHSPWLFAWRPRNTPAIRSRLRILVTHHAPCDAHGRLYYDPWRVDDIAKRVLAGPIVWAPNSPVCREAFDRARLPFRRLLENWTNVIFVDDWGAPRSGLLGRTPVIGRHSLPRPEKWPSETEIIKKLYPPGNDVQVRLMGMPDHVLGALDPVPDNWKVLAAHEIPVREFVNSIDFFVYFHHPDLVESFGRAPAEAISAGCVAILPPYLERTFGRAAVYCHPEDAINMAKAIAASPSRFAQLSMRGRQELDRFYGPDQHLRRIEQVLAASSDERFVDTISTEHPAFSRQSLGVWGRRAQLRVNRTVSHSSDRIRRIIARLRAAISPRKHDILER